MTDDKNEFEIIKFSKGETIFEEGDKGKCAYLVRSGVVKIYRMLNKTKLSITHLKAGQIIGEMAVISEAPRSASAEAAEDCELVKIDEKSLNNALNNTLPVIKAMLNQLIHRFRVIDRQSLVKESDKIFLCACSVVDYLQGQASEVEYKELYALMNSKYTVAESIFDNIMNKLCDQGFIKEVSTGKKQIVKYVYNGKKASGSPAPLKKEMPPPTENENEYIHISDFAKMLETTVKDIITRTGIGYIPEDIFYISRERAAFWAEDIGEDYFDKPVYKGEDI